MKILGIDPGSVELGWAAFDSDTYELRALTEKYPKSMPADERMDRIEAMLDRLLSTMRPDYVAVELQRRHGDRGDNILLAMWQLVRSLCRRHKIPCGQLHIGTARRIAVGNGHATKEEVRKVLEFDYKIKFPDTNASDAACIAVAALENAIEAQRG